ncbi:MAG TPA: hypothetical protein VI522_00245 [Gammaproteobacteria bacterium]|nr:hypothetical protein [Gammaproteobacteria bacterium]
MRNTFIIIGIVLALLVVGAWIYLFNVDSHVKTAIEKYGSAITGVAVNVAQVKIAPQSGEGKITDLMVGNPPGFSIPSAFSAHEINMNIDLHSISGDVVKIHNLTIIAPDVFVEQNTAGNNIHMLKDAIHAFLVAHTAAPGASLTAEQTAQMGKPLIIESFTIQGARLHAHAPLVQAEVVTVPLTDIQLNGIGQDTGGVQAAQAVEIIMEQINTSINQAVIARNLQNMIAVDGQEEEEGGIVDKIRNFLTR